MKKSKRPEIITDYPKAIIKELSRILASGGGTHQIYDDWLDMVHASLEALPRHVESAVSSGTLAPDTPEVAKMFESIYARYHHKEYVQEAFRTAFWILMNSAEHGYEFGDVIGDVYEEWGNANHWAGQYFTPWGLCRMMAKMTITDELLYERMETAYRESPYGKMHALLSPDRISAFVREQGESLVPLIAEYIKPVTISDPAVGSGKLLLAAAAQFPQWAVQWGLVQFYGMDIDQTCVKMAQVNMMLHGINGYALKCALALSNQELATLPEYHRDAYTQAQEADRSGNPERVEEIAEEVAAVTWQTQENKQMEMFNSADLHTPELQELLTNLTAKPKKRKSAPAESIPMFESIGDD